MFRNENPIDERNLHVCVRRQPAPRQVTRRATTCVAKRFRGPDDRRGTAIAAGVSSADRPPRMTAVYTLRHAPGSAYLLVHQIQRECGAAHLALNHHDEMPTLVDPMDLSA